MDGLCQRVGLPVGGSPCASSKLLRPRNQGLTLRLNSGPKTAKLRRYARRCCLPRLTWRPCHSGDVSAPRRPGVGERRFAAASDGAEERAPTPTARRHGTGFLGCPSRFPLWPVWASRLLIVHADTVARWHRDRFRRYWAKISQRRHPGRPRIDAEIRRLVLPQASVGGCHVTRSRARV